MNAERLRAHYEQIADAPDAIARLQRFILDLAVRGKLVPQNQDEEPAAELLKRIAKEKARLVKADQIRSERSLPTPSETDRLFELPDGWAWVRLGSISQIVTSGSRDWAKHYSNAGAIFVRMGNLSKDHYRLRLDHIQRVKPPVDGEGTRTRLEAGDVLISITGDVGMLGLIPEDFGEAYINQHIAMVRPMPEIKGRYLAELFRSPFAQAQFNEPQRGIKNSFRLTDVTQFVVPLPPLAEQRRIVTKVDELMGLCDRMEAARSRREAVRGRLAAASLARLNAPDPETFQADARFALDALPALTKWPDQIKALRQTILNLAVRGKLVPQDADDQPASELLKRLEKAKSGLVAAGKLRTGKSQTPSHYNGEQGFELPSTWSWARLTEIGQTQTGTSPSSENPDLFGDYIPFIKPADLDGNQINYNGPGLSEIGIGHSRLAVANSILMVCIGATLGKVNTTSRPVCFNQQINSLTPFSDGLTAFVAMALKASDFQSLAWSKAGTGTLPIISKGKWEVLPIPLPPLAEQHRIVAKFDALMALCDRLEASLTATAATRRRLLDALLAEALAPVENRDLEAAE